MRHFCRIPLIGNEKDLIVHFQSPIFSTFGVVDLNLNGTTVSLDALHIDVAILARLLVINLNGPTSSHEVALFDLDSASRFSVYAVPRKSANR